MASQGNNPNKGNQKGGRPSGKQDKQDGKPGKGTDVPPAGHPGNQTGNKSEGGKFDSGNQTNR